MLEFLAIASTITFAAATAWVLVRPYRSLAGRVRPYATVSRVRLTRAADVRGTAQGGPTFGDATLRRLFAPIVDRVLTSFGRLIATSNTERLMLRLRQAGLYPDLGEVERVQEFRTRSFVRAVGWAALFGLLGLLIRGPLYMVLFGTLGFVFGVLNARGRIDKAVS